MRVKPQRRLSAKELMLSNCGAGEDSLESLGLQGDKRTDPEAEAPIFWPPDANSQLIGKDSDAGKGQLRAGGEGDDRR